jgi:hypothetical protein
MENHKLLSDVVGSMIDLIKYKLSDISGAVRRSSIDNKTVISCDIIEKEFDVAPTDNSGIILIDALHNIPLYIFNHLLTGSYIGKDRNWELAMLLQNKWDRELKHIGGSFGVSQHFSLFPRISKSKYENAIQSGISIYKDFDTREELINSEYKGTQIGDLIYNSYLRQMKKGTVSPENKDIELLYFICRHILFHQIYNDILKNNDVRAVIVSHRKYSISGALLRAALSYNVEIFTFGTGSGLSFHKYKNNIENKRIFRKPSDRLFDYIMNNHKSLAVNRGERYLQERIDGNKPVAAGAYSNKKNVMTKSEAYERFNLSQNKPTGVLMSHALTDGVIRGRWNLFPDYLVWLREVISEMVDNTSVNWLIKPHPNAQYYDCQHSVNDEFYEITQGEDNHTVSILPDSMNTKSLFNFADFIFTVRGTAGLEFPAFGIPSIIAGESSYSGFDIAIEPETKNGYLKYISDTSNIGEVSDEQTKRARALFYIIKELIGVESSLRSDIIKMTNGTNFWDVAATTISENNWKDDPLYQALKTYNKKDSPVQHLISDKESDRIEWM